MAALTIRNLPDHVHDALRRQAAGNRRTMEAEARVVLAASVGQRPDSSQKARILADFWAMSPERRRGEPEGWSGVDEFLAEIHLDGGWKSGIVTDEEREAWLRRLGRFEIKPSEIEAFVASRARPD